MTTSKNLLAALAVAVLLAGCAPTSTLAPEVAPVVETAPSTTAPVVADRLDPIIPEVETLAVVGDSISAWAPAFANDPGQSWVYSATDDAHPLVGGWAVPGAKLAEMDAGITYTGADVLVIMAGTNDIYAGTPIPDRLASIDSIIAKAGAERVVISTVAPYGFDAGLGFQWNDALVVYAAEAGYELIDPWAGVRSPEGYFYPGTDYGDGIHPNPATATYVGQTIRALLDAA